MTKAELVTRQGERPTIEKRLEFIREERNRLSAEEQELRKLDYELSEVDEVYEGVPLKTWGETNLGFEELGDDGEHRQAFVNPYYSDEDSQSETPTGFLLKLCGATDRHSDKDWRKYQDQDGAVAAAKKYVAHGLVPLPDILKETKHAN